MTDAASRQTSSDANEFYLRSIDVTLSFIAERLPPPSESNQTYWLSVANAAALWAIVALMLAYGSASHF